MNAGERFADTWFNYPKTQDKETMSDLLAEDFKWETVTKARVNDKIFENKEDTLDTLSKITKSGELSVFYSSDEILVASVQVIAPIDNSKRGLIISVIFENGKAIKMISANGDGR